MNRTILFFQIRSNSLQFVMYGSMVHIENCHICNCQKLKYYSFDFIEFNCKMQSYRINLRPIGKPKFNEYSVRDSYKEFDVHFLKINQNIESHQFNEKQKDTIYATFKELIDACCKLNRKIVELQNETKEAKKISGLMTKAEDYMRNEINEYSTTWRRDKIIEKSAAFVRPQQRAIGIK